MRRGASDARASAGWFDVARESHDVVALLVLTFASTDWMSEPPCAAQGRRGGGRHVLTHAPTTVLSLRPTPAVRRQRPTTDAPAGCHRLCGTAGGEAPSGAPGRQIG